MGNNPMVSATVSISVEVQKLYVNINIIQKIEQRRLFFQRSSNSSFLE